MSRLLWESLFSRLDFTFSVSWHLIPQIFMKAIHMLWRGLLRCDPIGCQEHQTHFHNPSPLVQSEFGICNHRSSICLFFPGSSQLRRPSPSHDHSHCKIANFVAQQATLSNIACQATLAFVAETKLLIAIIAAWMKNWIAVWPNKLCHRFMPFVLFIHLVRVGGADDDFWVRSFQV